MRRTRVLVAYKSLPRYRVAFFSLLRERLDELGVDLRLVVGQAARREAERGDEAELDWAVGRRNRIVSAGGRELVYQPVVAEACAADLVVVEQANRLVANYALLAMQAFGVTRVAFWGHGANLQARRVRSGPERLKRVVSRLPHWWFAYTEGSRRRVEALGFPPERITVVQNAQDTERLTAAVGRVTPEQIAALRRRHGLGAGPIGLFLGSLYRDKRLGFLLGAVDRIAEAAPGFRLVIAGDGPERLLAASAARTRPWVVYLGRVEGVEARAELLAAADVLLVPGLVGLVVVDAFAAGVPLVTTAYPYHSPEIEYLDDGVNGLIVPAVDDADAYASAVLRVLRDGTLGARLRRGCADAAARYTVGAMVDRFAGGVVEALAA